MRKCTAPPPGTPSAWPTPSSSSRSSTTTPTTARKWSSAAARSSATAWAKTASCTRDQDIPDTVITNVVVLDYTGIYKADVALRDGHIFKIGKAGNPDITDGVNITIGAATDIIAGEHKILTAGGIDTHVHFVSPGPGPRGARRRRHHHDRRRHRPLRCHQGHHRHPRQMAHLPDAAGRGESARSTSACSARGTPARRGPLAEQIRAGAIGLKVHEDWGATHSSIDMSLKIADEFDVQVAIHSDTLNECGFVEDTIAAIDGRVIHTFHTEGAGGGHAPDIITHRGPAQRAPGLHQPHPAVHHQHHGRAPGHAHGRPPPQPGHPRGRGVRRLPHPRGDHRGRGRPARHGHLLDDLLRLPGHGPGRARWSCAPGRWPTP